MDCCENKLGLSDMKESSLAMKAMFRGLLEEENEWEEWKLLWKLFELEVKDGRDNELYY